jgi:surface protein
MGFNPVLFYEYGKARDSKTFISTWDTTLVSPLGAELAGVTASGTNWGGGTNLNTTGYTHTVGSTAQLVTNVPAIAMIMYEITCTIEPTGSTAGSVQVNYGNAVSAPISSTTSTPITLMALNTSTLRVVPTTDFNGNVKLSVKRSSSATNQIKLPLPNVGTYNIDVDWGDETNSNITAWNQPETLHTYSTPGEYTVQITGINFNWRFEGLNDRLKIKSITKWGKLRLGLNSFNGCGNLTLDTITDIPEISAATNLGGAFANCSSITTIGRIGEWNMTNVVSMNSMFIGAINFNQSLNTWERTGSTLANVTNLVDMFRNATLFNGNLSGWNLSGATALDAMFQSSIAFNNGATPGVGGTMHWTINTTAPVNMAAMFAGASAFNQNIESWNVSTVNNMASMFGFATFFNQPLAGWERTTVGNVSTLANVVQMGSMFYNTKVFNQPIGNWNTGKVTNMSAMFDGNFPGKADTFNQNIGTWDVRNVRSFAGMFRSCETFNNGFAPGVSAGNQLQWDTSACTDMSQMFSNVTAFNSNLGTGTTHWNVSIVTDFTSMFNNCPAFNNGDNSAPINNWSINTQSGAIVNMGAMFAGAIVFNRPLESWNVKNVTSLASTFRAAYAFDQPLAGWERTTPGNVSTLSKVENMSNTFSDARVFNQPIGNWNTSSVTRMDGMFSRTSGAGVNLFNRPIGNWDVRKVTNFIGMFYANAGAISFNNGDDSAPLNNWILNTDPTASVSMSYMFMSLNALGSPFNRNLSSWNTSRVVTMDSMFRNTPFNNGFAPGVENQLTWDTSACIDMNRMFASNTAFNSNLGNGTIPWNVSKVTNFFSMFFGCTSFNNGDNSAPINNWSINTQSGVNVNMSNLFYEAHVFNRPLENWNMTRVTNLTATLRGARVFNQPLANWERTGSTLANVATINTLFYDARLFNQPIGNWNVTGVNNMTAMFFNARSFNQPLAGWERVGSTLANVNDMNNMFSADNLSGGNMTFNQPIGNWNVGNVLNMSRMFGSLNWNTSFNQNIGSWNVHKVANFSNFMFNKTPATFSVANLDAIYSGWSVLPTVIPNLSITFGSAQYSAAGAPGKAILQATPNFWNNIIDGGQDLTYQTYTLDDTIINNPERGFYQYTSTGSAETVYNLLDQTDLTNYRVIDGLTVIQRQFFLFLFIDGSTISPSYLANMQTDFNRIRAAGLKVMARFTYTSKTATVYQPTKTQILDHIAQLAPVVNANKDVIVSIQAGFIGQYGEWYTTGSSEFGSLNYNLWTTTQLANRKEIVDAMLSQFDASILLQLRTVFYKEALYPSGNARIGFVNDAFLNIDGDQGTFNVNEPNTPNATQTGVFQTASLTAPITGEANKPDDLLNPGTRILGPNAVIELDKYNWSLINKGYYLPIIDDWITSGHFNTIAKNIGYRFLLNSSKFTVAGSNITVVINLTNIGYANSFRNRTAYIVFKNTSTSALFSNALTSNVNTWYSNVDINQTFSISLLPSGTYNSYLHIPDPSPTISSNPLYAIRLSNTGVWDPITGYNNLNQTFTK